MTNEKTHKYLNVSIALVWIVNGLICKILNFVPRHGDIVERILNIDKFSANVFTMLIGFSEIFMAIWILSGYKSKLNAITQIIIVATMNTLEFILVPNLLLWGKFNSIFALLFISIVYYNEFIINKRITNAIIS